jgi:hypothetical protein
MDGDMPDVFNNDRVKANKEHICFECKRPIIKGNYYWRAKGHWPDSGWQTFKVCEDCDEMRHELSDADFGYASFGDLQEWAQEVGASFPRL